MSVTIAQTTAQIEACYDVMCLLRPHLNKHQFMLQVDEQQSQGYTLICHSSRGLVDGVAGFVLGHKLAWGKHVYIDDLVVDSNTQSRGIGKRLLDWIIDYSKAKGCQQIHLDSGVQRFDAHRFYLREHFSIASHHFSKPI